MSGHESTRGGTVLGLLAADRVSGPAKGVFQFAHHAASTPWGFVLGLFWLRGTSPGSQCVDEAERRGVPYAIIEQRSRFDPGLVWRTYRVAKRRRVTLLQSHSYKGHLLSLLLRPFIRLPWVAFAHGWTDEDRRIRAYNRLDFRLLRYPDAVVAVSQDVRRRLEAAGVPSSRITVIPNAVDLPTTAPRLEGGSWRASLGLSPLRPVVSVIGRLSPEKGQDVFLRACGVARRCGAPFTAVLVGEGPSTTSLRAQVEDAGLSPIVRFAGYHSDVSAVYRESDIIVIPSRSEGLPNVLLEAMALGKPVIATNAGGIPEVIRNGVNGVLVPIADPESMARAMSMLLTSAEQRAILGRNAAATAPAFSPSTRAQRILALYDEVTATTTKCRRARPVQSSS